MLNVYHPVAPGQSVPDASLYSTRYTIPCDPETLSSDGIPHSPKNTLYANKAKTLRFIHNPICTKLSDAINCDVKELLRQHPDLNGLDLHLDNSDLLDNTNAIELEDFLPPSQYYNVLDIVEFTHQAENSFNALPARIRKQFNNNVGLLSQALERNDLAVLSSLYEYLNITPEQQNGETASRQRASSPVETSPLPSSSPSTTDVVDSQPTSQ